jgi:oxygen-independent coproporphyrinogen-3 oxidase
MYGIPGQSVDSFSKTLDEILSLSPEHISLYGLILEEGTPFWSIKDELPIPSEDSECDMYYMAQDKLSAYGYSHYEISNYAKAGYECRHNLKYWRCDEYIGVGVSAYSCLGGYRFGNSSDINEYLSAEREKYKYREEIDESAAAYEFVMLALRLREGFSLTDYKNKFGRDFIDESRRSKIKELEELGYIRLISDRIGLTDKGFYISNRILTDLL